MIYVYTFFVSLGVWGVLGVMYPNSVLLLTMGIHDVTNQRLRFLGWIIQGGPLILGGSGSLWMDGYVVNWPMVIVGTSPKWVFCGTPYKWPNFMACFFGVSITTYKSWDDPPSTSYKWELWYNPYIWPYYTWVTGVEISPLLNAVTGPYGYNWSGFWAHLVGKFQVPQHG